MNDDSAEFSFDSGDEILDKPFRFRGRTDQTYCVSFVWLPGLEDGLRRSSRLIHLC